MSDTHPMTIMFMMMMGLAFAAFVCIAIIKISHGVRALVGGNRERVTLRHRADVYAEAPATKPAPVTMPDEGAQPAWSVLRREDKAARGEGVAVMPLKQRGHTLLAAESGWGKTQTQLRLMVEDMRGGAHCYWLSEHSTLYNPHDQVTDLRPVADRFARSRNADEIYSIIHNLIAAPDSELERRKGLYDSDYEALNRLPFVALHIGEWPELYAVLNREGKRGEKSAHALANLIRVGRKYRMFIGSLDMQDGRAKHGLDTSDLGQMWTKIVGGVDRASWQNLGLNGMPVNLAKRDWFVSYRNDQGERNTNYPVRFGLASPEMIASIAQSGANAAPSVARNDAPAHNEREEPALVARWLQAEPMISGREVARRLYRLRAGLAPDSEIEYKGDGDLYYVARAMLADARDGVAA